MMGKLRKNRIFRYLRSLRNFGVEGNILQWPPEKHEKNEIEGNKRGIANRYPVTGLSIHG